MSTCAVPVVIFVFNRPEKLRRLLSVLAADAQLRQHLVPFRVPTDALGALRHLRGWVSQPGQLEVLIDAIGAAPRDGTESP